MRIDVTDADIAEGAPCQGDGCPIAVRLGKITGRRYAVSTVWIERYPDGLRVPTPAKARDFIVALDYTEYENARSRKNPRAMAFDLPDYFLEAP